MARKVQGYSRKPRSRQCVSRHVNVLWSSGNPRVPGRRTHDLNFGRRSHKLCGNSDRRPHSKPSMGPCTKSLTKIYQTIDWQPH